jgi:hypothetical protein
MSHELPMEDAAAERVGLTGRLALGLSFDD